jgi:hypothetical protein
MGSPIRTSTWRDTTTLATSLRWTARTDSATIDSNDESDVCGTMVGCRPAGRPRDGTGRDGDRPTSQVRSPSEPSGRPERSGASTVTHSAPDDSVP